jgi:hypothetical protein
VEIALGKKAFLCIHYAVSTGLGGVIHILPHLNQTLGIDVGYFDREA